MKKKPWKQIKIKKGIFQKLVISYIIFSLLTILSAFFCLILTALDLTKGDIKSFIPYEILDENGEIKNLDTVTNLGGWVEELDEEYRVLQVHGTKLTSRQQYSQKEIYQLLSADSEEGYIGFIQYMEQQNKYYLVIYDRQVMYTTFNIRIESISSGGSYLFEILLPILFLMNCILLSLYLRHKIKKPLDVLIQGMERVKAGERGVTLDFKTESEFEQIRDTFNLMTAQLEEEKQENAELVQKKNQLLMELSHDIKTPIATIKSYANALESDLVPEDKKQDYYHTIDLKADRLQQLSEDMQLMLKMDYADYELQLEEVDICELLRKICAEYYEEIENAGFSFEINIPEQTCVQWLDVRLFTRVIGNLLLNARKYNQGGTCIGVHLSIEGQELVIDVIDDGAPIAKEVAEHMFDAFMRGDQARKSDGGMGLGLSIAKAIIEKNQGNICYLRIQEKNCFRITLTSCNDSFQRL